MRAPLTVAVICVLTATYANSAVPLTPAGNGHLVVPAFVNGKGTLPFILDTGADGPSVYESFAKQQRLQAGKPESVTGMTGTTMSPTY